MSADKFYGRRELALLCAQTAFELFPVPPSYEESSDYASSSSASLDADVPPVAEWVAYFLYRTALPNTTAFYAIHLLRRVSVSFSADESSGIPEPHLLHHRLLLAAFILATKCLMDDCYSNKSFAIASRNLFSVSEIDRMELGMLGALGWRLRDDDEDVVEIVGAMEADWEVRMDELHRLEMIEKAQRQEEKRLRRIGSKVESILSSPHRHHCSSSASDHSRCPSRKMMTRKADRGVGVGVGVATAMVQSIGA